MTFGEEEYPEQEGEWTPAPRDECEEYQYATLVGADGEVLLFRQRWDTTRRLTDFAVILMVRRHGQDHWIAEADIRHGVLHVHIYNQLGVRFARENIQPVATQQDVEKAYDAAVDLMTEKWEDYKRRWRNG